MVFSRFSFSRVSPRRAGSCRFLCAWALGLLALLIPHVGRADCTAPAGTQGEIVYNFDYGVMQFCDGTTWVSMASSGSLVEVDPKVGALTAGNFCKANPGATAIVCSTAAISLSTDVSGTLQAAQFPALTGDVTTSAGSLVTTIANGAVTIAKLAATGTASSTTYLRGDGTWAPVNTGTVTGTGSAGYLPIWNSTSALTYDATTGGQLFWDTTNHRLGIGTTAPASALHIGAGQIQVPNGTYSAPSYGFAASTNSGMWWDAANNALVFSASSGQGDIALRYNQLRINATASLGFSSSNQAQTAAVDAAFSRIASGKIGVGNGTVGDISGTLIATGAGLGTTTPGTTLDVNGAVTLRGMAAPSAAPVGQGRIYFDSSSNKFQVSENGGTYGNLVSTGVSGGSAGYVPVWSSATALTYDATANGQFAWDITNHRLGIGSAAPLDALDVAGGYGLTMPGNQYIGSNIYYSGGWRYRSNGIGGVLKLAEAGIGGVTFQVAPNNAAGAGAAASLTTAVTILSGGNVGIGTTTPNAPLEIASLNLGALVGIGTVGQSAYIGFNESGGVGRAYVGYNGTTQNAMLWAYAGKGIEFNVNSSTIGSGTAMVIASAGNVGIGTTSPAASALLDVSTNTKGFLPPRMTTTNRDAISSPAAGLTIYNTTTNALNVFNGSAWGAVAGSGGSIATDSDVTLASVIDNDILRYDGATAKWKNVNIGTAMSTTTMVANWPDAIKCNIITPAYGNTYFYHFGDYLYRAMFNTTGDIYIVWNSNGTFNSYSTTIASDCNVSIASLYAAGKAFNFIGSSLASAAAPAAGGVQFNNGSGALAGDSAFIWDNTNKRLGVGTTSPAYSLDVLGSGTSDVGGRFLTISAQTSITNHPALLIGNKSTTTSTGSGLRFLGADTSGSVQTLGGVGGIMTANSTSSATGSLYFYTNNAGTVAERARLDHSGNFAVGSTNGDYGINFRLLGRNDQNATTYLGLINANSGASAATTIYQVGYTGNSYYGQALIDNSGAPYIRNYGGSAVGVAYNDFAQTAFRNAAGNSEWMRIGSSGNVGIGTTAPAASALLDVSSTSKGFLPPRMTKTNRDAINSPATGLTIYNTTTNALNIFDGTSWSAVAGGGSIATDSDVTITSVANNDILRYDSATAKWKNVNIGTAMSTTTMVANWPDAIRCNTTSPNTGYVVLQAALMPDASGNYVYVFNQGATRYQLTFTSAGAYSASDFYNGSWSTFTSDCGAQSIAQNYASGRAFNFIGSSLASAAAPSAGGVQFNNGSGSLAGDSAFIWDNTNKRLGVGTTNPGDKLQIYNGRLKLSTDTNGGGLIASEYGGLARITAAASGGGGTVAIGREPVAVHGQAAGTYTVELWSGTNGGTQTLTASGGNVGIGTTSPGAKLEVAGNATLTGGNLQISNADPYLQWYENDQPANGRFWDMYAGSGILSLRAVNDAYTAAQTALQVVRSGATITSTSFPNGNVGIGTTAPAASALLDLSSTGKGFLPPRMTTTQRDAIASPATGLTIYNTSTNSLDFYNGTAWSSVGGATTFTTITATIAGNQATTQFTNANGNTISAGYSGNVACPAGATLVGYGLRSRAQHDDSGAYDYNLCDSPAANTIRAYFYGVNSASYYTTCYGICATSTPASASSGVPSGAVMAFNLATCPTGWSEYTPARGRFVRGIDSTGANDPDGVRALGSTQADAFQGHTFTASGPNLYQPSGGTPGIGSGGNLGNDYVTNIGVTISGPSSNGVNGTPRTASETRPKNVALLYCQKD